MGSAQFLSSARLSTLIRVVAGLVAFAAACGKGLSVDSRSVRLRFQAASALAIAVAVLVAAPAKLAWTQADASASPESRGDTGSVPATTSTSNLLFGAYTPSSPESGVAATNTLETALGRRVDIVLWYQHWDGWGPEFHTEWVDAASSDGRIPLLTWEPWAPGTVNQPNFRLRRIADGAFDPYIRTWAHALAAYGKPVYLRPMHEMNGNWYPWCGTVNANTPVDYIDAWRHLHDIFAAAGATNARWVWSPYALDVPAGNAFERYYPGSQYVDVLALDGYNWGSTAKHRWQSFDQIFSRPYKRIAKLGPQPVWIAETASDESGGDKAAWVREMFRSAARYPRLQAIVWFNLLKERDWRATAPQGVASAFAPLS
jgi:Glycosyl hydrolase family 26